MNDKGPPRGIYAFAGDTLPTKLPILEQIGILLTAGAKTIQLRLKATADADALEQAALAVKYSKERGTLLVVNDRPDIVMLSGARGLHLGEEDIPVGAARRLLGAGACIGKTIRNLEQAQKAKEEGADYVGLGPIFETQTKRMPVAALGVEQLFWVVKNSPLPVVAIGGISAANISEVAGTGAHAAAVISDIWKAENPGQQVLKLESLFAKARPP